MEMENEIMIIYRKEKRPNVFWWLHSRWRRSEKDWLSNSVKIIWQRKTVRSSTGTGPKVVVPTAITQTMRFSGLTSIWFKPHTHTHTHTHTFCKSRTRFSGNKKKKFVFAVVLIHTMSAWKFDQRIQKVENLSMGSFELIIRKKNHFLRVCVWGAVVGKKPTTRNENGEWNYDENLKIFR